MAFKDIHKLKKIQEIQKENIETDFLVLGHDLFSLSLYHDLVKKYGEDRVRFLSQEKFEKKDLAPKGPSGVRGLDNMNFIRSHYSENQFEIIDQPSQFYKDMQWKVFGGRSKSEALKFHEEHFTTGRIDIRFEEIFSFINQEGFIDWLNERVYAVKVKSIFYNNDEKKFIVECVNGTEFVTKELICGVSPAEFLNFYKNKNELSDQFIQFSEGTHSPSALYMKFDYKKPLTDMKESLFIPLSYTHEWGHFMGEFRSSGDQQSVDFVHFIDKDHTTEEDVSRIIRLLKKNLEKIFQQPKNVPVKEYISIEDASGCLKIDDDLFNNSEVQFKNLHFIGLNAPLAVASSTETAFAYSLSALNYEARALMSVRLLQEKLLN